MNQAQLVIQWDKSENQIAIIPQNMTNDEVTAVLRAAIQVCDNSTFERAKNSSGIVIAPAMPKVKGD